MTDFPRNLPGLPAPDGARELALRCLDEARQAVAGLESGDDPEALHDFRVALRRLRGLLRAYRPPLGPAIPKRLRRALRKLTARTGVGRNAQVEGAWISDQEPSLTRSERTGARWLRARLAERQKNEKLETRVPARFGRLERRLRKRLAGEVDAGSFPTGPTFAAVTARLVTESAVELVKHLRGIRGPESDAPAHRARIAGKRLRYLLEPVADAAAGAPELIERLRGLQTLLGEFDECHLLATEIASAVADLAAERARLRHAAEIEGGAPPRGRRGREDTGLLTLARRVRARRDQLFRDLEREWLGDRAPEIIPAVRQGAATLAVRRISPHYRAVRRPAPYRRRSATQPTPALTPASTT